VDREHHDVTTAPDRLVERLQARIIDLARVFSRPLSDRDGGEHSRQAPIDPSVDAAIVPSARRRILTGINVSGRDFQVDEVCIPSDSLRDQLVAIRRRLWIVNATLETLPAKIEQTYRAKMLRARGHESAERGNVSENSNDERLALDCYPTEAGWWARRKLTKLRSRASRAESRAAAALYDASVSFGEALEAVLKAAVARVKADEACLQQLPRTWSPGPRSRQ
jgi:hypothetical protein